MIQPSGDGLPTRTYGGDILPARCQHCGAGSSSLDTEPPLGSHQRGMVTCMICSRQVCWLTAPLRTAPQPSRPEPSRAYARLDGIRARGCGQTCTGQGGHDALLHEEYGRQQGLAERMSTPIPSVVTGPLVVDVEARRVWVEGIEIALSRTELDILIYLAGHLGRVCRVYDVVAYVWDVQTAQLWGQRSWNGRFHTVHTAMSRLRIRLGPAAHLLETRLGVGFILLAADPVAFDLVSQPLIQRLRSSMSWSRDWAACQACGTTRKPHHAHGLCSSSRRYRKPLRPTKGGTP